MYGKYETTANDLPETHILGLKLLEHHVNLGGSYCERQKWPLIWKDINKIGEHTGFVKKGQVQIQTPQKAIIKVYYKENAKNKDDERSKKLKRLDEKHLSEIKSNVISENKR